MHYNLSSDDTEGEERKQKRQDDSDDDLREEPKRKRTKGAVPKVFFVAVMGAYLFVSFRLRTNHMISLTIMLFCPVQRS